MILQNHVNGVSGTPEYPSDVCSVVQQGLRFPHGWRWLLLREALTPRNGHLLTRIIAMELLPNANEQYETKEYWCVSNCEPTYTHIRIGINDIASE